MGLEGKINMIKSTYKENYRECREYDEGIKAFNRMISLGIVKKRGNRLARPNELHERRIEFNNYTTK